MSEQPSLFSVSDLQTGRYLSQPKLLPISRDALQSWKQRIFDYQQQIRIHPVIQQGTLFDAPTTADPCLKQGYRTQESGGSYLGTPPPDAIDPDQIDPFRLPQQNTMFWRWKTTDSGIAALYFVIDCELPLLLYVGETCKSGQRWKGEHDCKRYLDNYLLAHYPLQVPTRLGIAFWSQAPHTTKARQAIELALIRKWRSPFNKENWEFWGTPFVGKS